MTTDEGRKLIEAAQANLANLAEFDVVAKYEAVLAQAQSDVIAARAKVGPLLTHRRSLDKALDAIKATEARKVTDLAVDTAYSVLLLSTVQVDQLLGL